MTALAMQDVARAECARARQEWATGIESEARVVFGHDPELPRILRVVSRFSAIPEADILGPSQRQPIARARQFAMFKAVEAGITTTEVGRFFGRDHSTVTHACQRMREALGRA